MVTIVGTIVWIGITNDRLERLDRRQTPAWIFDIDRLRGYMRESARAEEDLVWTLQSDRKSVV
mgnify:CR=1 FL=1